MSSAAAAAGNHFVDEAARGGDGIGELLPELRDALGAQPFGIDGGVEPSYKGCSPALRPHHRNFGRGQAKFTSVRMCLLDMTQ